MSEIPEFLRERGDQMFRELMRNLTPVELKTPATTPRVLQSPFVAAHNVLVMDGSQFEDGLDRFVVSDTIADDIVAEITRHVQVSGAVTIIRRIVEEGESRG